MFFAFGARTTFGFRVVSYGYFLISCLGLLKQSKIFTKNKEKNYLFRFLNKISKFKIMNFFVLFNLYLFKNLFFLT